MRKIDEILQSYQFDISF